MTADHTSRFAFVVACIVAPLTIVGSAVSLYGIARAAGLGFPLALPVATDLTALVAAAQIRACRHLALAWCTLVAGVLGSAALQVADAWDLGPSAWVVHGALPLAALVCFELAMPERQPADAAEPSMQAPMETPGGGAVPSGLPATPESLPGAVSAGRRRASSSGSLDTLVGRAEKLAKQMGVAPTDLSQRALRSGLRIGDARAREVHRALRHPQLSVAGAAERDSAPDKPA
jgi:hypothetical protein